MAGKSILLLDSRDREIAYVGLSEDRKVVRAVRAPVLGATRRILSAIRRLAKSPGSIAGIVVAQGPGSFTAVRMGVVVANALAFGLNVPISGVRLPVTLTPSPASLARLAKVQPRTRGVVLPVYDAPVSITKKKWKGVSGKRSFLGDAGSVGTSRRPPRRHRPQAVGSFSGRPGSSITKKRKR